MLSLVEAVSSQFNRSRSFARRPHTHRQGSATQRRAAVSFVSRGTRTPQLIGLAALHNLLRHHGARWCARPQRGFHSNLSRHPSYCPLLVPNAWSDRGRGAPEGSALVSSTESNRAIPRPRVKERENRLPFLQPGELVALVPTRAQTQL